MSVPDALPSEVGETNTKVAVGVVLPVGVSVGERVKAALREMGTRVPVGLSVAKTKGPVGVAERVAVSLVNGDSVSVASAVAENDGVESMLAEPEIGVPDDVYVIVKVGVADAVLQAVSVYEGVPVYEEVSVPSAEAVSAAVAVIVAESDSVRVKLGDALMSVPVGLTVANTKGPVAVAEGVAVESDE